MELQQIQLLSASQVIYIAFKTFAIIFSVFYLFYALVIRKQTQIMNKTLQVENNGIFSVISSLQITAALILIIFAILLV